MNDSLARLARFIAGRRRPRSHAIDPKVMEAGRWMEDIRREQLGGRRGEVIRAMVIVEVRAKPDDPGTGVLYSTDRTNGYRSPVEASGLLEQAKLALELVPQSSMLASGLNQVAAAIHSQENGAAEKKD